MICVNPWTFKYLQKYSPYKKWKKTGLLIITSHIRWRGNHMIKELKTPSSTSPIKCPAKSFRTQWKHWLWTSPKKQWNCKRIAINNILIIIMISKTKFRISFLGSKIEKASMHYVRKRLRSSLGILNCLRREISWDF